MNTADLTLLLLKWTFLDKKRDTSRNCFLPLMLCFVSIQGVTNGLLVASTR